MADIGVWLTENELGACMVGLELYKASLEQIAEETPSAKGAADELIETIETARAKIRN